MSTLFYEIQISELLRILKKSGMFDLKKPSLHLTKIITNTHYYHTWKPILFWASYLGLNFSKKSISWNSVLFTFINTNLFSKKKNIPYENYFRRHFACTSNIFTSFYHYSSLLFFSKNQYSNFKCVLKKLPPILYTKEIFTLHIMKPNLL